MVDQEKQAKLMGMVAHLLAKTVENGATVEEAASAAAKVQALVFKYNLDLAAAAQLAKSEKPEGNYVKKPIDLRSAHTWKRDLFFALCWCNFGRGVVWQGRKQAYIIAEDHNIQIIEHLYVYLEREIRRLANEAWYKSGGRAYGPNWSGEGEGTYKDRFGRGAVTAVISRLYAQREASKVENTGGTALIVVKDEELKRAVETLSPDSTNLRDVRRKLPNSSAWADGVKAGKQIALNPALNTGS